MIAAAAGLLVSLPLLLGGVLPLDSGRAQRWPWSGAWVYPVGAPRDWQSAAAGGPAFHLLRGFGAAGHRGADLGDGAAGAPVRACAHGLVVQALRDSAGAWGDRVVMAHRLVDGRTAYSVYAHLEPGSIAVRVGQVVGAGDRIARVGRSGNATTPHLHFEVRVAALATRRWETVVAVDPLAFVERRLVSARALDEPSRCMTWAEEGALIAPGTPADEPLRRSRWWAMLAGATAALDRVPSRLPDSLAACLRGAGVLSVREPEAGDPDWPELVRDLRRLEHTGHRLAPPPLPARRLTGALAGRLGGPEALARIGRHRPRRPPRIADAALLVAALAAGVGPGATPRR